MPAERLSSSISRQRQSYQRYTEDQYFALLILDCCTTFGSRGNGTAVVFLRRFPTHPIQDLGRLANQLSAILYRLKKHPLRTCLNTAQDLNHLQLAEAKAIIALVNDIHLTDSGRHYRDTASHSPTSATDRLFERVSDDLRSCDATKHSPNTRRWTEEKLQTTIVPRNCTGLQWAFLGRKFLQMFPHRRRGSEWRLTQALKDQYTMKDLKNHALHRALANREPLAQEMLDFVLNVLNNQHANTDDVNAIGKFYLGTPVTPANQVTVATDRTPEYHVVLPRDFDPADYARRPWKYRPARHLRGDARVQWWFDLIDRLAPPRPLGMG